MLCIWSWYSILTTSLLTEALHGFVKVVNIDGLIILIGMLYIVYVTVDDNLSSLAIESELVTVVIDVLQLRML